MKRKLIVTCPNCGREYLPCEIFIPKAFFGAPELIQRNVDGTIRDVLGPVMDTTETYCCDSCNTTFKVNAKISFETSVDVALDFDSDYESTLKPKLKLEES